MSKAAREIPGQRVMSRLLARVSARPLVGPSPAFYARFGLDDPWASAGCFTPDGPSDPFTYVDGRHYYARIERMRWARHRLLSRIAEMDAGAAARGPSLVGRQLDPARMFRSSQLANVGVNSAVMLEAPAAIEPETDERAGRFVARQAGEKRGMGWAPAKPAAARPLARALRQTSSEMTVLRVVEELRASSPLRSAGSEDRSPARRALTQALTAARALPEEQQVEVARRAVRKLRGVQRRIAELAIEEMAEEGSGPLRVAMARMPAPGRSRKGLRPVLSSSPALVALAPPESAAPPEPRVERRVASRPSVVVRPSAHREAPVAPAMREARTQQVTGRAGPEVVVSRHIAPVAAAPIRRRPTEWAATLARDVETGAPIEETSRGLRATRRIVRSTSQVSRVAARAHAGESDAPAVRLASSPTAYVRTRPMRTAAAIRTVLPPQVASVAATETGRAAPARAGKVTTRAATAGTTRAATPRAIAETPRAGAPRVDGPAAGAPPLAGGAPRATSSQRATQRAAASPIGADRGPAPVSAPIATTTATVRAAARADTSASAVRRTSRISAAPTSYVRSAEPVVGLEAPAASRASRGIVRAIARAVAIPRQDGRGIPQLSAAPVAHARAASAERIVAPEPERALVGAALARIAPHRRVIGTASESVSAGELVSSTARAATRADLQHPKAAGRGAASLLASAPTAYLARPEHPLAVPEVAPVASRLRTRAATASTRPVLERVEGVAAADSATVRAVRRGASSVSTGPVARRVVLAAAPTRYLTEAPEPAEQPAEVAAPVRLRPIASAHARAESTVRTDDRGVALATERVGPMRERKAVGAVGAVATRSVRRTRSSSPVAQLLEHARSIDAEAAEPAQRSVRERVSGARAIGRAASIHRAETGLGPAVGERAPAGRPSATRRLAELDLPVLARQPARARPAPTSRVAERAASVAGVSRAAASGTGGRIGASRHALLRGEAFTPSVAYRDIVTAAASVLRARDRQRTVRPAMAHVANEFRWAIPAQVPVEPPAAAGVARREGPITRAALARVVNRVSAAVRAMERPERGPLLTEGPRQAFEGAARADRRRSLSTANVPFTLASLDVDAGPEAAAVAPRGRQAAWAERRATVETTPVARTAGAPPPTGRLIRRAFAGVEGVLATPIERAAVRSELPEAASERVRYRTQRTAPGRFEPSRRIASDTPPSAYALGAPGVPRRRARLDAATGLVLPRVATLPDEAPPSSPGRRVRAGARATPAETRPARRSRPFMGTLGYLSTGEPSADGGIAAPARRSRPPTRAGAPASVYGQGAGAVEPESDEAMVPGWASRAIEGTVVDRPQRLQRLAPKLATSGHLLTALARADRPEDVVRVLMQSSDTMRSLTSELSAPAARLVDRIVRLGSEDATTLNAIASSAAVASPRLLAGAGSDPSAAVGRRVRRKQVALPPEEGGGSSQAMRLAKKLMNLIHLVETERKVDDVRKQVRLSENGAGAEARAGAPSDGGGTKPENVNMKALQRDVLEAVLRELELNQQRRQEDPDGRTIWW